MQMYLAGIHEVDDYYSIEYVEEEKSWTEFFWKVRGKHFKGHMISGWCAGLLRRTYDGVEITEEEYESRKKHR